MAPVFTYESPGRQLWEHPRCGIADFHASECLRGQTYPFFVEEF